MKATLLKRAGVLFLMLVAGLSFCTNSFADEDIRYTKYNVHVWEKRGTYDSTFKASYANYTNPGPIHHIVPAGSKISVLKTKRKLIRFKVERDEMGVDFEFHAPRMGMDVDEYLDKITSKTPVSLQELTAKDKEGVAQGKALVGMTRKGVMTALGYPATHRTPSLDSETYVYWTNRFKSIAVDFDGQGKVKAVRR